MSVTANAKELAIMEHDPEKLLGLSEDELYLGLGREVAGAAGVPQSLASVVQKGKHAFGQFAAQFKPTICGSNGPRDGLGKLTGGCLVEGISTAVLSGNPHAITAAAALYVGALVAKMGLNTYCAGFDAAAPSAASDNPR
jgi:hypothetical protein